MRMILLCEDHNLVFEVYTDNILSELAQYGLEKKAYKKEDIINGDFSDVEYIFSTWGMAYFTEEEIKRFLPNLKCIFYAAGTVRGFASTFLNCGVKVFSAWAANAVPVSEFTVAQIVLANKGYFKVSQFMKKKEYGLAKEEAPKYAGNYGTKIGIIGAGMIGKNAIKLMKSYKFNIMVFDPFLSDEDAETLGVKKVSLEEIFTECDVVSNHLANNEQTKNMLTYDLFSKMKPYSSFVNTGRAAQVEEDGFIKALKERPDISAIIDVYWQEPLPVESPLYELDNCFLTPHIAGVACVNEYERLSEYMLNEFKCFIDGGPCKYEVTQKMLETMA